MVKDELEPEFYRSEPVRRKTIPMVTFPKDIKIKCDPRKR